MDHAEPSPPDTATAAPHAAGDAPGTRDLARHRLLLTIALVLVGLNLRPALTALSPILKETMRATGLSAGAAGLLTTLPVLGLGVFAPLAPRLAARLGPERGVLLLMLLLAAGNAARWQGSVPMLFLTTPLIGAAIGMANVLLPGIVKRDFPHRMAQMTGLYSMALVFGAAAGSAFSAPLLHVLGGWAPALAVWALPALLAALLILPCLPAAPRKLPTPRPRRGLWHSRLAWEVTLYMGVQSTFTYIVFAWLAPLLRDRGMDAVSAGIAVSLSSLTQALTAAFVPLLARVGPDQRMLAALAILPAILGLYLCLFAPVSWVWVATVVMGLGQGSTLSVALTLIVYRAADAQMAARLSGMTQTFAYVLAAAGPALIGVLHQWSGNWAAVAPVMTLLALAGALLGLGAGRNRVLAAE